MLGPLLSLATRPTPTIGFVVGLLLLWPAESRAGCGDHVVLAGETAQAPTPVKHAPCQCPHCERRESAPLVPPASTPSAPAPTDLLAELPAQPRAGMPAAGWAAGDSGPLPPAPASTIFHPPRA